MNISLGHVQSTASDLHGLIQHNGNKFAVEQAMLLVS